MTALSNIKKASHLRIVQLIDSPIKSKLMEMGMIVGQEIAFLFKAPFGDPIAIEINDSVLSLRLDEAKYINVEFISA